MRRSIQTLTILSNWARKLARIGPRSGRQANRRERYVAFYKTSSRAFDPAISTWSCLGLWRRGEWTSASDVDWTLLIDGQASPDHRRTSREISERLARIRFRGKELPKPGAEQIFGSMAFSHDIIHHIGGQQDSNRNTTQRVLLLLEAIPIRAADAQDELGAYERVVREILYRYLHDDTNFFANDVRESRIPRFLLNDIVRYWRTMCVDFAYKEWEQAGIKWAIRNIKLRMSRKMLFVSALLTVFSCYRNLSLSPQAVGRGAYVSELQQHLMRFVKTPSLGIVVWSMRQLGLSAECGGLLDNYEEFVRSLNDEELRTHLGALRPQDAYSDASFLQLREASHQFQAAPRHIFFEVDTPLREFTIDYGVF